MIIINGREPALELKLLYSLTIQEGAVHFISFHNMIGQPVFQEIHRLQGDDRSAVINSSFKSNDLLG